MHEVNDFDELPDNFRRQHLIHEFGIFEDREKGIFPDVGFPYTDELVSDVPRYWRKDSLLGLRLFGDSLTSWLEHLDPQLCGNDLWRQLLFGL